MRNAFLLLLSAALASGCATQLAGPEVTIEQQSRVDSLQITVDTGLPVEYALNVTNPFDHPIKLTSVEIETVGQSGAYSMKRVRHAFDAEVAPHATQTFPLRAWVQKLQQTDVGEANGPVTVRGIARFDSPNGVLKTAFATRVQ